MIARRIKAFLLDIIEVVVFAIAIFLFLYLLVLQPHKIKGASMEPNFPDGEYLLTDKVTYRFREPARGDVIVFAAPPDKREEFIKRIIATPGENISIHDGHVYIDGNFLSETYLSSNLITEAGPFFQSHDSFKVPSEHYVVLGDNRPYSSDSRSWGLISKDDITGRAWVVYWPLSSAGFVDKAGYTFAGP